MQLFKGYVETNDKRNGFIFCFSITEKVFNYNKKLLTTLNYCYILLSTVTTKRLGGTEHVYKKND